MIGRTPPIVKHRCATVSPGGNPPKRNRQAFDPGRTARLRAWFSGTGEWRRRSWRSVRACARGWSP